MISQLQESEYKNSDFQTEIENIIKHYIIKFKTDASNQKYQDLKEKSNELDVLEQLQSVSSSSNNPGGNLLQIQNLILEFRFNDAQEQVVKQDNNRNFDMVLLHAYLLQLKGRQNESLTKFRFLFKPIYKDRFRDVRYGISLNLLAIKNFSKALIGFMKNYSDDNSDESSLRGVIKCIILIRDLNISVKYSLDINMYLRKQYELIYNNDNLTYKMYFMIDLFKNQKYKECAELCDRLITKVQHALKAKTSVHEAFSSHSDLSEYKKKALVCNQQYLCYYLMKSMVHLAKYKEAIKFYENQIAKMFPNDVQLLTLKCQAKKFVNEVWVSDKELKFLLQQRDSMRSSNKYKYLRNCIDILMIEYQQTKKETASVKRHIESILNPEEIRNEEGMALFRTVDRNAFFIFINQNYETQPALCKIILEKLIQVQFADYSLDLAKVEEHALETELGRQLVFIKLKLNLAGLQIKFDDEAVCEALLEECKAHLLKLQGVANKLKDFSHLDFGSTGLETNLRMMNIVLKQNYAILHELQQRWADAITNHRDILHICPKLHESAFRLDYLKYHCKGEANYQDNFVKLLDKYSNAATKHHDPEKYYRYRQRILQYWAYLLFTEGKYDKCKDLVKENLFAEEKDGDGQPAVVVKQPQRHCHQLLSVLLVCQLRLSLKCRTDGTDDSQHLSRAKDQTGIVLEPQHDSLKNYVAAQVFCYVSFCRCKFTESLNFTNIIYEKLKQYKNMSYNSQWKMAYYNCVFNLALFEYYNENQVKAQNNLKELLNPKLQLGRLGIDQVTVVSLQTLCSVLDNFTEESLDHLTKLASEYSSEHAKHKYQNVFIGFNLAYCQYLLAQNRVNDPKRTSKFTTRAIAWIDRALQLISEYSSKKISNHLHDCVNSNKLRETNINHSMVSKTFKKISTRLMDLFAELSDLKEHCGRCLEQDLLNENIKKTEYQSNYDTYSRQEAERLSKLKEIKIKEEEKKQIEKSQLSKLQDSMNELFSDVHTKIANQADKNQSRVIKRKRESQEPDEDNIINENEEEEELELPSDDEDSDYERKHTQKQKKDEKKKRKVLKKEVKKEVEEDEEEDKEVDALF